MKLCRPVAPGHTKQPDTIPARTGWNWRGHSPGTNLARISDFFLLKAFRPKGMLFARIGALTVQQHSDHCGAGMAGLDAALNFASRGP
jgi:hypothetical protein